MIVLSPTKDSLPPLKVKVSPTPGIEKVVDRS
jgi:hypothetical protein